jgi:NADH-quinone oxidoreductase subunit N
MFLTLEVNFILFITFYFFISFLLQNFVNMDVVYKRFNFSFFLFSLMYANLLMCYANPNVLVNYTLWNVFTETDMRSYFIKLVLVTFQFFFFVFTFISYKNYLRPEIFYFFNISLGAALFMTSTNDWVITFVLFELSSMPIYVLIALKKNRFAIEAAIKYLIFGAFASQFFILSYIFYTNRLGTNKISDVAFFSVFDVEYSSFAAQDQIFAIFFILSIFIKFGVGPFYSWLIDVYQASSYPIFVYNSTISKLIAFIPLFSFGQYFSSNTYYRGFFILILLYSSFHAVISIFFQNNIRRFFGYSSVINFSFLMLANFFTPDGTMVFFKYLIFYCFILFSVYSAFEIYRLTDSTQREPVVLEELGTSSIKAQQLFFSLAIVVSSGLPPIGLFYAKAYAYGMVLSNPFAFNYFVAFFLILNSILALFAYFRAIAKSYNFANKKFHSVTTLTDESASMLYFSLFIFTFVVQISLSWTTFINFVP